jgi:hypothetical protein
MRRKPPEVVRLLKRDPADASASGDDVERVQRPDNRPSENLEQLVGETPLLAALLRSVL